MSMDVSHRILDAVEGFSEIIDTAARFSYELLASNCCVGITFNIFSKWLTEYYLNKTSCVGIHSSTQGGGNLASPFDFLRFRKKYASSHNFFERVSVFLNERNLHYMMIIGRVENFLTRDEI